MFYPALLIAGGGKMVCCKMFIHTLLKYFTKE